MNQEKHYNTLTEYYLNKYNSKVAKIALNANFTCPNRDGTKGYGGCTYCSKLGSGDTAGDVTLSLTEQYNQIKTIILKKWKTAQFIPYLQAYSNTYAPLRTLKDIYESILRVDPEHIVEFSIATRADCFTKEIYDYLEELNRKIPLTIELGLQSSNEETGKRIHRQLTNDEFITCVKELHKRNIQVVVHIINGLPEETKEDMLKTIDFINDLDVEGIKIHSLLLLKHTLLYEEYLKKPFPILSLEEYVEIVTQQIAKLKPSILIHRLSADGVLEDLVEPKWAIKKLVVMNEIDKHLRKWNIYQGDNFKQSSHHH